MDFLKHNGEIAELIRAKDWLATPLGIADKWPDNLKTLMGVMLNAPIPMFIYWGAEFNCLYNDAVAQLLNNTDKHPNMLGKPAAAFWAEAWHMIEQDMQSVMFTGKAFKGVNVYIPVLQDGKFSSDYWNYALTPVFDNDESTSGILMILSERTDVKSSSKELQVQDERFEHFMQEATVGIITLIGEDFVTENVNKTFADLIDRSPEELLHKPLFSIIPEIEAAFKPPLYKVLITGEPFLSPETSYLIYVNGKKKEGFLDITYRPFRGKDKNIAGVLVICQDRTLQVLAKKQLEENDLFTQSVFYSSPIAKMVFTGMNMVIKRVNEKMLEMLDRNNSIIGKPFMEIMPELKDTLIMNRLQRVFTTGLTHVQPEEELTIIKQGIAHKGHYNYIYKALHDVQGNKYGVMITAVDVTNNVQTRTNLEKSEQQVRALLNSAPFPIGVYEGRQLRIILANQSMLDTWGKGNNVVGKLYTEILPELKETAIFQQLDNVLTTGTPFHAQNIRVDIVVNGILEIHYFNYSFTPVFDENGEVYAVMNTAANVTDLNIAKQKIEENELLLQTKVEERTASLKRANAELLSTNKELEEFSFAASHDLQEPLRKVEMFTGFLQKSYLERFDEKGKTYLNKIFSSVQRMRNLINDLLDYSQQTREGHEYIQTNLNEIITLIETDLELEIIQKKAVITKDTIPEIDAIPTQLRQLFQNLFSNALKFAKPASSLHINIGCTIKNEIPEELHFANPKNRTYIEIIFSDNGIGFEQQYATYIFSMFKRLHGKNEYDGTGIGLALCKKVAENHNGSIAAFSAPGEGSIFKILLPLLHENVAAIV